MYITFSVFILNCIEYFKNFLIFKNNYLSINAKNVPNNFKRLVLNTDKLFKQYLKS